MELATRTEMLWNPPTHITAKEAGKAVCNFLDVATTSYGRVTHYNSRMEQQEAELRVHDTLLNMSRDLYAVFMALPGVLDRSIQVGLKKLLSTHRNGVPAQFLTSMQEGVILHYMIQALPAQRMLKMIDALRVGDEEQGLKKANNARTRKLILRTILGSPRLQLWSVKYRTKVRRALVHAWGKKKSSYIREILKKRPETWSLKEKGIVEKNIYKYIHRWDSSRLFDICECIRFVFGDRSEIQLPMLKSFVDSKKDLKKGAKLPPEVLEGIRATYHKSTPKEEIIKLTKDSMTDVQKLQVQKRAKKAKVDVQIDPLNYDAVRLYLYAFECGLTKEIEKALDKKAEKAARSFPAKYQRIGIVVDMSKSMEGGKTQPLRPAAAALATRDMLTHVSNVGHIEYVGGGRPQEGGPLIRPMGDTGLADGLVRALEHAPEAVFVISDGYENSPAGRFAEVLSLVREAGIDTPVFHLNPVMAAESGGVREISDQAKTLPLQSPAALGTTIVRGLIETDPVRGINSLVHMALDSGPAFTVQVIDKE